MKKKLYQPLQPMKGLGSAFYKGKGCAGEQLEGYYAQQPGFPHYLLRIPTSKGWLGVPQEGLPIADG